MKLALLSSFLLVLLVGSANASVEQAENGNGALSTINASAAQAGGTENAGPCRPIEIREGCETKVYVYPNWRSLGLRSPVVRACRCPF